MRRGPVFRRKAIARAAACIREMMLGENRPREGFLVCDQPGPQEFDIAAESGQRQFVRGPLPPGHYVEYGDSIAIGHLCGKEGDPFLVTGG